ncbi:MAG: hypothetical protein WKG06_10375 [Segetibacter sp.]
MKRNTPIQLKAAFLMIVFSLNTIIGFACTIGINMGFNSTCNEEANETSVHVHADGKKHSHHNAAAKHHDKANNYQPKSKDGKDNCCNDKVTQFAQLDKALSPSLSFLVNPVFFTAFASAFYNIDVLFLSQGSSNIKYFVRSHHPPIPDIRIAIQSFQI